MSDQDYSGGRMSKLDVKVLAISRIVTEEWTKRTAQQKLHFTSAQIVSVAEAVIATKMYQMLDGLEKIAKDPDESKVIAIRVDWQQEMEWGLEAAARMSPPDLS